MSSLASTPESLGLAKGTASLINPTAQCSRPGAVVSLLPADGAGSSTG